ncbi:MAG TPA: hypothetical protein VMP01_26765 [Pirellulaceae bacterium]|nr:hypothetical protein [Pirellulaceae bacterium]
MPQSGLHIEHVSLNRVAERVREPESLAFAVLPNVNLKCVSSYANEHIRAHCFKRLL